jgi:hypothetical protein
MHKLLPWQWSVAFTCQLNLFESILSYVLPTIEHLEPAQTRRWPNVSLVGHNLKPLRNYEDAIKYNMQNKTMQWTIEKTVLSYIDLMPACESVVEKIFCFVYAGLWSLKAATDHLASRKERYAMSKMVFECFEMAVILAYMFGDIGLRTYILGLAYKSTSLAIVSIDQAETVLAYLKKFLFGASCVPTWHAPIVSVAESILLRLTINEIENEHLLNVKYLPNKYMIWKREIIDYFLFENCWSGSLKNRVTDNEELVKGVTSDDDEDITFDGPKITKVI